MRDLLLSRLPHHGLRRGLPADSGPRIEGLHKIGIHRHKEIVCLDRKLPETHSRVFLANG